MAGEAAVPGTAAPAAGSAPAAGTGKPPASPAFSGDTADKGTAVKAPGSAAGAPEGGEKPGGQGNPPEGGKKGAETVVKRMLKAVIDGKETEVSEEDAVRAIQKLRASEKRFQEAAQIKKQNELIMANLRRATKDPRVLQQIIKQVDPESDLRKLSEQYLYELIQEEQMDPKDRELKKAKEELAKIEQEKQSAAETERQKQAAELQQKYTKQYQTDIIGALEESGLPKSEYTIARMARYMHMGLVRGVELQAKDVVEFVWQDYRRDLGAFRALPVDKLLDMLGPELADKIREYDLAKLRRGEGDGKPPTPPAPIAPRNPRKPLSMDELRARAEARANQ